MPDPYSNYNQPGDWVAPPTPPSLQYRLSAAIAAIRGRVPAGAAPRQPVAPQPPDGQKTQDSSPEARGWPDANYLAAMYRQWTELFQFGFTRQRRYTDYSLMDTGQTAALLDAVVDAVLVSDDGQLLGFKVEAKAKYQNIIDQICHDLNLQFRLREILRDTLKNGDNFVPPVFDDYWNIRDLENPPPAQMWVFVDPHNRLLTGTEKMLLNGEEAQVGRAYQQKNLALTTVAGWQPFEMFHLKYAPKKNLIYSEKSMLEDIRADWYKLKFIEEALVMHRLTRASPRYDRIFDATKKSDIEAQKLITNAIKEMSKKKLTNNQEVSGVLGVEEDFYRTTGYYQGPDRWYPKLDEIKMLDPRNTGINRLDDVNHFVRKIFSRVPSEVVGILPDREDISAQDIAASRLYSYCQAILTQQLLKPLFNLGLALKGYTPEDGDYKITFPCVEMRASWRLSDAKFRQSMADANEIQNGIVSRKRIAQSKYGFTDEEWNAEKAEIKKEAAEMPPVPKATDAQLKRKGNNSESLELAREQYVEHIMGSNGNGNHQEPPMETGD